MQDNGWKAQALDNYPSLTTDPEICRLRLELARQARKMDPDTWKKHFEETVSKRHLIAVADSNYWPMTDWSDNRFDAYKRDSQYLHLSRRADASQGDRLQIAIKCTWCHQYKCFDEHPEYTIQDHLYIVKDNFCNVFRRRFHDFEPVDQNIKSIQGRKFRTLSR